MTTVAIYGGSFDPPHLAHQMACLVVLETEAVDELWMVPTWRHALDKELSDFEDRCRMCELATAVFSGRVRVSRIEQELAAPRSRTLDTLRALAARHRDTAFRLVVGADILAERDAWHRWDDVVALAPPIVIGRAGYPGGDGGAVELPDLSSTEIRARLARGAGAAGLVSRAVMDYIAGRGLYR